MDLTAPIILKFNPYNPKRLNNNVRQIEAIHSVMPERPIILEDVKEKSCTPIMDTFNALRLLQQRIELLSVKQIAFH